MDRKKERQSLEKISKEYILRDEARTVDNKIEKVIADYVIGEMRKHCDSGKIIEMGFGDDVWTQKLIDIYGYSSIIDASENLLSIVKKTYKNEVKTINKFFEDFIPVEKYDQVLCSYVLEHVISPIDVLSSVKSWINKTGVVHILVPHANSLHRRLAVEMGLHNNTFDLGEMDVRIGHRRVYTVDSLLKDIEKAGLSVINICGLFIKPVPNFMMKDYTDGQIIGLLKLSFSLPIEYTGVLYVKAKICE